MASARDHLAKREKELEEVLAEKERRVKELEMEVLSLTQKMVRMDGDHANHMREKQEELEKVKVGGVCDGRVWVVCVMKVCAW